VSTLKEKEEEKREREGKKDGKAMQGSRRSMGIRTCVVSGVKGNRKHFNSIAASRSVDESSANTENFVMFRHGDHTDRSATCRNFGAKLVVFVNGL
jgi:hypothetical protein